MEKKQKLFEKINTLAKNNQIEINSLFELLRTELKKCFVGCDDKFEWLDNLDIEHDFEIEDGYVCCYAALEKLLLE